MTDPTNPAAVVEQVDRDAAADFVRWQRKATDEWKGPDGETDVWQFFHKDFSRGIRQGIWDEHPIAQAFARHRLLGIEQGRAEMREEAAEVASEELENRRADQKRDMMSNFLRGKINAASRILDAIRAIPTAKERG